MKQQILITFGVVAFIAIVLWQYKPAPITTSESLVVDSTYQNLSALEFDQQITDDVFLLDVHIPEQTHIIGTDAFISFDKIEENADRLPEDKNVKILVYCRSGNMSEIASETLLSLGYTNVNNLIGGKNAYDQYLLEIQKQGELTITPDNQDLGTVIYGDVPEAKFTIENGTNRVVNLTRVSTSCGCTKAFPAKEELNPGESITMKVTFDPAVHGDATDVGVLTRTIYVETDHPDFEKFENTITANVILQ